MEIVSNLTGLLCRLNECMWLALYLCGMGIEFQQWFCLSLVGVHPRFHLSLPAEPSSSLKGRETARGPTKVQNTRTLQNTQRQCQNMPEHTRTCQNTGSIYFVLGKVKGWRWQASVKILSSLGLHKLLGYVSASPATETQHWLANLFIPEVANWQPWATFGLQIGFVGLTLHC